MILDSQVRDQEAKVVKDSSWGSGGSGTTHELRLELLVHIPLDFTYRFKDIIIKNVKSAIRVLNCKHGSSEYEALCDCSGHAHEARLWDRICKDEAC